MFVNLDYSLKNFPKCTFYESEIIEIKQQYHQWKKSLICACVCERRKKQTENQWQIFWEKKPWEKVYLCSCA